MGMIPKTTKSDIKIFNNISVKKLAGFFMTFLLSYMLGSIIFEKMSVQFLFMGFALVVYLICMCKSPTNPDKVFILGLVDFLRFKFTKKKIYGNTSEEYSIFETEKESHENKKKRKRKEQD
jgi:NhaP-type Na+/H+ or K+/H+ antiporter